MTPKLEPVEVGQRFQWVVAKALVVKNGALLLVRRKEAVDRGLYELPGGKVEVGENLFDGLRREVKEETGLEIRASRKKQAVSELEPFSVVSDPRKHVALVFLVRIARGAPKSETKEQREIRFYSKAEVRKLLEAGLIRPLVKPAIEKWLKR